MVNGAEYLLFRRPPDGEGEGLGGSRRVGYSHPSHLDYCAPALHMGWGRREWLISGPLSPASAQKSTTLTPRLCMALVSEVATLDNLAPSANDNPYTPPLLLFWPRRHE